MRQRVDDTSRRSTGPGLGPDLSLGLEASQNMKTEIVITATSTKREGLAAGQDLGLQYGNLMSDQTLLSMKSKYVFKIFKTIFNCLVTIVSYLSFPTVLIKVWDLVK